MFGVEKTISKAQTDREVDTEIRKYRGCTIIGKKREKINGFHIVDLRKDVFTLIEVFDTIKESLGIPITKHGSSRDMGKILEERLFSLTPEQPKIIKKKRG